jgi:hypothetical protein
MLQSDKGISSIRLAEALGVSQPTAWHMGHALRLMVGREQALDGVVEIDGLYVGGKPRREKNYSPPGRGRKGLPKTQKTPALVAVQRPPDVSVGAPAGETRATVIEDLSESEADRVLSEAVDPSAHLMSDEWMGRGRPSTIPYMEFCELTSLQESHCEAPFHWTLGPVKPGRVVV